MTPVTSFQLQDGFESTADSSDIQDTFNDEFRDTFENYPRRPPKRDHNPPNIFTQGKIPNHAVPDYAVFVDPPRRLTSRRPLIQRPPPKHPGVRIPGVEHPPNSGSIQDIINHFDSNDDEADDDDNSNKGNNIDRLSSAHQASDFDFDRRNDHVFTPEFSKHEFEQHSQNHHYAPERPKYEPEHQDDYHENQEHEYQGYRPPIGHKGPPKYSHEPPIIHEKYPTKPHVTEDYHVDAKPTYYDKPPEPAYHEPEPYKPPINTYKPAPPPYSPPHKDSYKPAPPPHQDYSPPHQDTYKPPPPKPYVPPYQPEPYHKPVEKPIPPVEPYGQGPAVLNSLINPPGPDIFDGQSLYSPSLGSSGGEAFGYHGNSKVDRPGSIDRIDTGHGFGGQNSDPDYYDTVSKVQPIILQESSSVSYNGGNNNNDYQRPPHFSPYDQHSKGSKHYQIYPPATSRPSSNINLNAINSYTSMGASNSHANLQGLSSSHNLGSYTYSSGSQKVSIQRREMKNSQLGHD